MNRIFKSKWSVARQTYVATDEIHSSKDHKKTIVAAAVAAAAMIAGAAQAAYVEPGFIAENAFDVASAKASWETAEYQKDWGLTALNASTAYALGFNGSGVAVGIMDSGALMKIHPDLAGDRFHAVEVKDQSYGSSGNRYPQHDEDDGLYTPDSEVPTSGQWQMGMNDTHGTHVTGTVGGNRDGSEFHGVAWGADIYVGNTGGTDDTNYGPFQDPQFFYEGWSAIAEDISSANTFADGTTRGGFINNSFGTNIRVVDNGSTGADGGSTGVHFPSDTVSQTEYEYFLFQQDAQNRQNEDEHWNGLSFVDAAFEAVKDKKVVQVFTTGNRDFANPFYRPLYPYFNPEAENYWVAVAGIQQGSNGTYELVETFNEAGNAKWWTVAAPGYNIYSSKVDTATGEPTWGNSSGTSMAAPHVTGALAVLMSRYEQMDALQVRDVMLTTATHTNPDGTTFKDWTAAEGEVDERYGWGMPDLEKGMYGPGQLLGTFDYNMQGDSLDVWSNDISEVALNQRKTEDAAWKAAAQHWLDAGKPLALGDEFTAEEKELLGDILLDTDDDIVGLTDEQEKISEEDAIAWREAYYQKRIDAINARVYDGSIVKEGTGKLVMTGTNTYEGTTTVKGGTLLAFQESIGTDNTVTVEDGGTFGVLSAYDDQFTMTGYKESQASEEDRLTIEVKSGGTLYVSAGSDVTVKLVKFDGNKDIVVGLDGVEQQKLIEAYHSGEALTGTFTSAEGTNVFEGVNTADAAGAETDSLFFNVTGAKVTGSGNTLTTSVARNEDVSFSDFAKTSNERAIAAALEGSTGGLIGSVLMMNDAEEINSLYSSLSDDMYASARNAMVVNALSVTRGVIDQARGLGEGRAAELENGMGRIWASGMASWTNADGQASSVDADFRVGMIGGEVNVCSATKLGAFFGYGSTDYDGKFGKIDGDDVHFGVYGLTDFGPASFTYGVSYMQEDRDSVHYLGDFGNSHSEDASVLQAYAEGAWNFDLDVAKVSPYVGFTYARVDADGFTESGYGYDFRVKDQKDDIEVVSLGVRGTLPFMMGTMPVALKADAGWSHFFGDTESVNEMQLGAGGAYASIEGNELDNQFNLGLGIAMQVAKSATVNVSYTGAFGSDTDSHGLIGTFRYAF